MDTTDPNAAAPDDGPLKADPGPMIWLTGLRGRLLALTVLFVLLAELLIFPPSAANFRTQWLNERVQAAQIAALALEAAPERQVSEDLSLELLQQAQLIAVATGSEGMRELLLGPAMEIDGPVVLVDLRREGFFDSLARTIALMFSPSGRYLRIIDQPKMTGDLYIDVLVPEAPLKRDLMIYCRNIIILSLLISGVVGGLVYVALYRLVVRPMARITRSVTDFADAPDAANAFEPSGRLDEIGRAETALREMQSAVSASFRQKKRLADLGEAVAKINHDLRNSLTAAQLASDTLAASDDPRVKRSAPRLERAIERAIGLAEATLRYGKAEPPAPNITEVVIGVALEEAAAEGLSAHPEMIWTCDAPADLRARADVEHVHRIVANLVRNAAQALGEQADRTEPGAISGKAWRANDAVVVDVRDNGPGVPEHIRTRMFQPFAGSASRDGSGLGLAIARELARGLSGDLTLYKSDDEGTVFRLTLPAA